ncbi:MAG: hypothetical protein GXZ08_09935 [Tissierellia bacterium]|nr:hypothetical protein [Tissierellia bacterium]
MKKRFFPFAYVLLIFIMTTLSNTYAEDLNLINDLNSVQVDTELEKLEDAESFDDIEESETIEIYEFELPTEHDKLLLHIGESVSNLKLPKIILGHTISDTVEFEITWRYEDFDNSNIGTTYILGDITLDDKYIFLGEIPIIKIPVVITKEEQTNPNEDIIIESVELHFSDSVLLKTGLNSESLNLDDKATASYDNNELVCNVEWKYEDFNANEYGAGRHKIIGEVLLPEGYKFLDEPITVERYVYVYDDTETSQIVIVDYEIPHVTNYNPIVPVGITRESLENYLMNDLNYGNEIYLYTEYGDKIIWNYEILFDYFYLNHVSSYTLIHLDLPSDFIMKPGLFLPSLHIIPGDAIYLDVLSRVNDEIYKITWLYDANNPQIMCTLNGLVEDWINYEEVSHLNIFSMEGNSILINTSNLEEESITSLAIKYDGNKYSNYIVIYKSDGELEFDFQEGIPPGIDREEQTKPDPNPDDKNDPEHPKGPNERDDDDYSENRDEEIIFNDFGDNLSNRLLASDQYITYIKNNLSISIPTDYLRSLSLGAKDKLSVIIKKTDKTIQSVIKINDKEKVNESEPELLIKNGDSLIIENQFYESDNNEAIADQNLNAINNNEVYKYSVNKDSLDNKEMETTDVENDNDENNSQRNSVLTIVFMCALGVIGVSIYLVFSRKR